MNTSLSLLRIVQSLVNPFNKARGYDKPEDISARVNTNQHVRLFDAYSRHINDITLHQNHNKLTMAEWTKKAIAEANLPDASFMPTEIAGFVIYAHSKGKDLTQYRNLFLSYLVQASFSRGYHTFNLDVGDSHYDNLLERIEGSEKQRIVINLKGNVGSVLLHNASYTAIHLDGECGDSVGLGSEHCNFYMNGNTGTHLGFNSRHSCFTVLGETGYGIGSYSEDCTFRLHGKVECDWPMLTSMPSNCVFMVKGNRLRRKLERALSLYPGNNNKVVPL
jgi:hypothetical protein